MHHLLILTLGVAWRVFVLVMSMRRFNNWLASVGVDAARFALDLPVVISATSVSDCNYGL